jgi:hypothetical protein
MSVPPKIFWFCFIRQLKELYFLLYSQKFISCSIEEFIPHFTGKKWGDDQEKYKGKIKWSGEGYLLKILEDHLTEKGFLEAGNSFAKHFDTGKSTIDYETNRNSSAAKSFRKRLEVLFPETTGLRCKQRLFYRYRNKEGMPAVLKHSGIIINKIKQEN